MCVGEEAVPNNDKKKVQNISKHYCSIASIEKIFLKSPFRHFAQFTTFFA